MSLFSLRLSRRVELRTRDEQIAQALGHRISPRVLRAGERVDVLDVFTEGFYCETRHGRALLGASALRPGRGTR